MAALLIAGLLVWALWPRRRQRIVIAVILPPPQIVERVVERKACPVCVAACEADATACWRCGFDWETGEIDPHRPYHLTGRERAS